MKNQKTYKPKMANVGQMWPDILIPFANEYNLKLTARDISPKIKIPRRTVSRILNNLVKRNIIRYIIEGKNKKYYLDLTNLKTKLLIKFLEEYKSFKLSTLYPEVFLILEEILPLNGVVLFGSFSKGNPNKESDIDLLIIGRKSNKIKEAVRKFGNKEINIHFSTWEEFKGLLTKRNILALEIIRNHIIFDCSDFIELCWRFYKNEL